MLKKKYDVSVFIPKFFNMVATQFNAKIKVFRFDNAPELMFTEFSMLKGLYISFLVWKDHNKPQLWRESIRTYLMLLEPYIFIPGYQFSFGMSVFLLPLFSLT